MATNAAGRRTYQVEQSHTSPVRVALIGLYALPPGIPVAAIELGGIGTPWNKPPFPGCVSVFLASDKEGRFGHRCPRCEGYWRSGSWANVCPYCGLRAGSHDFLSEAQHRFVQEYCRLLLEAMASEVDGDIVIDMDAVVDAVTKSSERPAFYVAERSQQHKFACAACGEFNDILGRFGYCSTCGTRNDLMVFRDVTVPAIRERVNSGGAPEDAVRDAVAAFDSLAGVYGRALSDEVPLSPQRRARLTGRRYHDAEEVRKTFREWFDIDVAAGIKPEDWALVVRMFHRRHVYEHKGGEVDGRYIEDSGDTSVVPKQHIHETKEAAHRLLGLVVRMAENLHAGFHVLVPARSEPISAFEAEQKRRAKLGLRPGSE